MPDLGPSLASPDASACRASCRRAWRAAVVLVIAAALAVPVAAQESDEADPAPGLANPLEAQRLSVALAGLVERARLIEQLAGETARAYRGAAQRRREALDALAQATRDLDQAAVRPRSLGAEQLERLVDELERARERYEVEDRAVQRHLAQLRGLVVERDALSIRIADLRSRLPQQQEQLTGVWEVTWMPAGIVGTFYLDQSGTLVSGQYDLGTHGTGSLQGTFVSGKLFLQRIDARRGRDAEIEGVLSSDGRQLRGTWTAYEMAQGGTPHGQWVARRVQ
ncbi:MAG: hypothetical protein D6738_14040 [Acidobacteria bacterium]|nr:MAG: hypothetical protein D6738_14040 [Acidobacteriota bacterium]